METKSQLLVEKMVRDGFPARILVENEAESTNLNSFIGLVFFEGKDSRARLITNCRWTNYSEQKACLSKLFSSHLFKTDCERDFVKIIPIFGPDQTVETTIKAILHFVDDVLDIDCFLVYNPLTSTAIIQRKFGVMDLLSENKSE